MKRGQPIHPVTDPHNTMLNGHVHFENIGGTNDAFWYLQDGVA